MDFSVEKLIKSEELEKKINITCSFNNAKCGSFREGKIINIKKTNVNLVEPHKVDITIKGKKILVIYFDTCA